MGNVIRPTHRQKNNQTTREYTIYPLGRCIHSNLTNVKCLPIALRYATTKTENDTINLLEIILSRIFNVVKSTQIRVLCMRLLPRFHSYIHNTNNFRAERFFFPRNVRDTWILGLDTEKHNEKQVGKHEHVIGNIVVRELKYSL